MKIHKQYAPLVVAILFLTFVVAAPSIVVPYPKGTIEYHESGHAIGVQYDITDAGLSNCWYTYNGANTTTVCDSSNYSIYKIRTNDNDDGKADQGVNQIIGNSFTSNATFEIEGVSLLIYRTSSPGEVIVSIREFNNQPIGMDLTNATFNGNTLGTSKAWKNVSLPPINLTAGKQYAILMRIPGGGAGDYVTWRLNTTSIFSEGYRIATNDLGTTWTVEDGQDYLWEVLSKGVPITVTDYENTSIEIWGNDSSNAKTMVQADWNFFSFSNNQTFSGTAGDLSAETFEINLRLNETVTGSSAILNYSGTTYIATKSIAGNNVIFNVGLDTPAVTASSIQNISWILSLTNASGTTTVNTHTKHQALSPSTIEHTNATYPVIAINFTIQDEKNLTYINASMKATINWNLGGAITKNKSFDIGENWSHAFSVEPNETYTTDIELLIQADGYEDRVYQFVGENLTNGTDAQHRVQPLYLLSAADSRDVIIEVKDQGLAPLEDYKVEILRYYPGSGNFTLVESQRTDFFGTFVAKLEEDNVRYKFKFYDTNNAFVKEAETVFVSCRTTICVMPFVIEDTEDDFERFDNITDFAYTLGYDNNTRTFTYTWTDNSGDGAAHRLEITKFALNGTTIVYNGSSTAASGSLIHTVGTESASYTAQAYRKVVQEQRVATRSTDVGSGADTFGLEGLMWAMVLLLTLISTAFFSPAAAMVLFVVGFIFLGLIGIIHAHPGIYVAVIVIGGLFAWAFRS